MTEPRLSRRQAEVANLMRKGLSSSQIAAALDVSIPTVKNHMGAVYQHFGIDGSTRGKQQRFIDLAGAIQIQPQERRRIINLVEVKQLQCATSEEIDEWRDEKPVTKPLMWQFCLEAVPSWCAAQRSAGKCIRDDLAYQRIVDQRSSREERAA